MKQSDGRQSTGGREGMPRRVLALAMAFALIFTSFNLPVLAEGIAASQAASAAAESTVQEAAGDAAAPTATPADDTAATAAPTAEPAGTAAPEPTSTPAAAPTATPTTTPTAASAAASAAPAAAFAQSAVVDGITITVTADAGVLPADAVLQASRITDETALAGYTQAVDGKPLRQGV